MGDTAGGIASGGSTRRENGVTITDQALFVAFTSNWASLAGDHPADRLPDEMRRIAAVSSRQPEFIGALDYRITQGSRPPRWGPARSVGDPLHRHRAGLAFPAPKPTG